jgi:hypothetical protein
MQVSERRISNYSLISSDYNAETGESVVTIHTEEGNFTGKARLHPADADNASRFFGCQIAEQRAAIKWHKTQLRILREQETVIFAFVKETFGYENNTEAAKHLTSHPVMQDIWVKHSILKRAIKTREKGIENAIKLRDKAAASKRKRSE